MSVRAPELALWLLRPSRGGRELETRLTDARPSVWLAGFAKLLAWLASVLIRR
jgi:hypothetical protein